MQKRRSFLKEDGTVTLMLKGIGKTLTMDNNKKMVKTRSFFMDA